MKKVFDYIKKELKETKVLLKSVPPILMTFFVLSLVLMNLLANKSLDLNLSWLALDSGIVISWLAFLTMDILVRRFGPKAATKLSVFAILVNLLVSFIFIAVASIPGTWGESYVEVGSSIVNTALDNTIAGSWYILLGSTLAFLVSSVVNNLLNWSIVRMFKKKPNGFLAYAASSYGSTFVAQVVDNLLFSLIVSLNFFGWSFLQCLTCSLTGGVVELVCQALFSPIGFALSKKWEKEGVGKDYLDLVGKTNPPNHAAHSFSCFNLTNKATNNEPASISENKPDKEI